MKKLHRLLLAFSLILISTSSVEGQLSLSAGGAYAEALDGQWGLDGVMSFGIPAFPADVFAGADYFWTSCDEDCSLWGWRLGGRVRFPVPVVSPYFTGALVGRKWELGNESLSEQGLSAGLGVSVKFGFSVFGEVNREFLGDDLDQWVMRVGLKI